MTPFEQTLPEWNDIDPIYVTGKITGTDSTVCIETSAGVLTIDFYPWGVRLRFGQSCATPYGILTEPSSLESKSAALGINEDDRAIHIACLDFELTIEREPFSFELRKHGKLVQRTPQDAHFVRRHRLPPAAKVGDGWFFSLDLSHDTPVYGLGEKWARLDKRGQLIRSENHDALGVNAELSYKNTPFAWSTEGWGVFIHTAGSVAHAVGYAPWSQRAYGLFVEDTGLDLFLFHADNESDNSGNNGADIIKSYCDLTGYAPVPPTWSLGTILSKAYYQDADELLATAREVRRREMPCDVITLDGRAWQDTDTRFAFEWDSSRYPDPAQVLQELKDLNFKVCIWEYPLVSVKHPLFQQMSDKGWLLKDRHSGDTYRYQWDTSPFGDVLTPLPESGLVDFTHPEAYAFWRDSHKELFDIGIDMIKADFGEQVNDDMQAYNGATGAQLHNVYSLLYNRCVYEAAERYSRNGPFLFSRSAWTGSQRYPAQWGGDPQADWGGLAASLRGGLSWGMSGAPFYATDVGGFYGDTRDAELYVRWVQAAVFSAHIRLHGIGQREPWSYESEADFGSLAKEAAEEALALRYRLLPYIHGALADSSRSGLPVQRAMALAFPNDRLARGFEEQFMFGASMLVAPCLQPGGAVELYLPEGKWLRYPSGEAFEGGRVYRITLKLNELAVFVREGERIPMGAAIQFIDSPMATPAIEEYWPRL